jgi:hypothetical protein
MQVKASAVNGTIQAGMRLAVGGAGQARALKTVVVEGVTLAEAAPSPWVRWCHQRQEQAHQVSRDPIPIHTDSPGREDKRTQCGP